MKKRLTWILILAVAAVVAFAGVAAALADPVVFGIQRSTGDVYAINPTDGTYQKMFNVITAAVDEDAAADVISKVSPNGLAYDSVGKKLYYTDYPVAGVGSTKLYYWSPSTGSPSTRARKSTRPSARK